MRGESLGLTDPKAPILYNLKDSKKRSPNMCWRYLPVLLRGPFSPREGLKG